MRRWYVPMNFKVTFDAFFKKMHIYNQYANNQMVKHIYENILSTESNIIAMIEMSEAGKPAICACIPEIDAYFNKSLSTNPEPEFNLNENFPKQTLGTMVKIILEPFGYLPKSQKGIPKGVHSEFVKSAMTYQKTGEAKFHIVKRIEEISSN